MKANRKPGWALPAVTLFLLLIYLPGCFVYILSPASWWPMGIISIGFPYTWFVLLLLIVVWFFVNGKIGLLLLLCLVGGLPVMKNVFALHPGNEFSQEKEAGHIRVMQWNCEGLKGFAPFPEEHRLKRVEIVAFINRYKPDVICMQDFSDTQCEGVYSNIALLKDSLGYAYSTYSRHYQSGAPNYYHWIGLAIFSKFPFTDSGRLNYPGKPYPETILWAEIALGRQKLRLATTHLQSMHLSRKGDGLPLEKELWGDSLVILHESKIGKLKYFQPYHVEQASYLRKFLDTSKLPLVFTGDLNSVPASWVYKRIKGNLRDAFLEKGFGMGRTYESRQPALRIDYIFHNEAVSNQKTSLFRTSFSDHDPLIMDFNLR